tara:strand:- start:260 stop:532 length:273 start_codon:yes stop_codon:yes gene_type:complete
MSNYYCPYCNPNLQVLSKNKLGEMICCQCGEKAEKKPLLRPVQLIAFATASVFLMPLIIMIVYFIQEAEYFDRPQYQYQYQKLQSLHHNK